MEFFAKLTAEQQRLVVESLQPLSFDKGALIVRQGDIGNELYVIKTGEVRGGPHRRADRAGAPPRHAAASQGRCALSCTGHPPVPAHARPMTSYDAEAPLPPLAAQVVCSSQGKELARIRRGGFFGERSLITDEARAASRRCRALAPERTPKAPRSEPPPLPA